MSDKPHGPMTGANPGSDGSWFDQALYDAVMAVMPESADDPDYGFYYEEAAIAAARIAAERKSVSDEELGKIAYYAACTVDTHEDYGEPDWDALPLVDRYAQESHIVAARAVRAALGPAVPVITAEQLYDHLRRRADDPQESWRERGYLTAAADRARESINAMTDAIDAAKERDHDHS